MSANRKITFNTPAGGGEKDGSSSSFKVQQRLVKSATARGRLQPERAAPPDAVSSRLLTASASGMMRSSTGAATVQQRKPAGQPLHTQYSQRLCYGIKFT